ncbi:Rieske (2Fe-2S) protein [Mycobacterium alsense]|uniref:Rieske (2Fe-2S) protein n=1 Tax=Mycobacterium alsense TaxID=324058 RepID=A0ABD6P781_9MYCO|nr:aromatic ring-hydroxylating dioxygenase subunit alpha [Mycobacterium alsense]OBG44802.1 Rieske (2Fe-2S) protein [Mycobacterium alsense]
METIARNQWYVAAYSHDIVHELFARTICNEPILFWRTEAGQIAAMSDRCVHRRYPLSAAPSRLEGDRVVCGYHGFTYGSDGGCVSVPGQTRIPRTARLTSYQVVEQDSFVWVWISDPENPMQGDPSRIPRAPWMDSPDYTVVSGMEPIDCNYRILVDNLMDLSHETYLHGGHIGTSEVASTPITTEVDEDRNVIYVSRHMDDAECPPFYSESTGIQTRITRWQDIEYIPPCLYLLHSRVAPLAAPLPEQDGADPHAFHVEVVYAITPETENSTHDFWAVARDFALQDHAVSKFLAESNRTVVMQDVAALNVLQQALNNEKPNYQELSINIDAGGLGARRLLQKLVEAPRRAGAGAPA